MAVSYWPFLDMLRAYFGFLPEDDDRARGTRIAASVAALVQRGDLTERQGTEMLPLLGNLLGPASAPTWTAGWHPRARSRSSTRPS